MRQSRRPSASRLCLGMMCWFRSFVEEGHAPQLPPLDYRHGWNLSRFCDQIHLLHALMFNGSRMLFIAHDCSPWGNNSRTLTVSSRSTARMAQQPGLIFVTLCCLLQELLGRRSLIENPVGSDLFLSEQHLARHLRKLPYHVQNVDQCQFGANLEGFFKKEAFVNKKFLRA